MITNWGFAQSNTKLQGPAAKNAKPWHKKDSSQVYIEVESGNRPKLQGPKAKNYKPWMSPMINEVDSIATRDSTKIK